MDTRFLGHKNYAGLFKIGPSTQTTNRRKERLVSFRNFHTGLCRDRLRSNGNAEERRPEVQIRTSSRNELCLTHHLCQDYSAAFPANVATTGMF